MKRIAPLYLALCCAGQMLAQCPAPTVNAPETNIWTGKLINALAGETSCSQVSSDNAFAASHACNFFVGRVLETLYNVRDFEPANPSPDHPYMQANDIGTELQAGILPGWTLVGTADSQDVLNQAKGFADQNLLVVAVYVNPTGDGHIALIGPGPMTGSDSWALSTPVSASFFIGKPLKDYFGKPLACAFKGDIKSAVKIWVKNG
jgi:hypothetical protein